jgi:hypothetical protein
MSGQPSCLTELIPVAFLRDELIVENQKAEVLLDN